MCPTSAPPFLRVSPKRKRNERGPLFTVPPQVTKMYFSVTPFFPSPDSWRGAYCFDFVKALMRQVKEGGGSEVEGRGGGGGEAESRGGAWRVLVFVPGAGDDYEIDGVRVCRFPTRQLPSNIFPFLFRRYNERSFLNKARDVMRREEAKPDCATAPRVAVCHAHTANYAIYALAAKRAFGCKALLHHHDLASFGLNLGALRHCALYNAWLFCRLRKLFEQIDCHVFISEASRKSFLSAPNTGWTVYGDYQRQMRGPAVFRCRPVRIKGAMVVHNGVDERLFGDEVEAENGGTRTRSFSIGCVGNFIGLKDQASLIKAVGLVAKEALPCLDEIKVIFIGSGPELEACKRLASRCEAEGVGGDGGGERNCSLAFEFHSEVPHARLPAFYRSLDLFVLPSYFEGFGCVFTEAWSCGVPFIACEGQGTDDLIAHEDRHLWLAKPRDPVDLAAKIRYYIDNRPQQRLVGKVSVDEIVAEFLGQVEGF